jgi:hypothetical protein
MKRSAKIAVGAGIAFTHFGLYLVCISTVVANDSVGDSNSPFLAAVTPVLGFPLMKTSGRLDIRSTPLDSRTAAYSQVKLASLP